MTFNKPGGFLMKILLFISYYFPKETDWVFLCHKRFKKTFAHESKY